MLVNFFVSAALVPPSIAQQKRDYATEAGIDSDGNIYVASDAGKRINMATWPTA